MCGSLPEPVNEIVMVVGIIIYNLGVTLLGAGWFALLSPIIPEAMRGNFFGRLRITWQTVAVVIVAAIALFLQSDSSVTLFQLVLGFMAVSLLPRIFIYARMPEMEPRHSNQPFATTFFELFQRDGFVSFCSYLFLLSLFTTTCPVLFALVEKQVLGFGDDMVTWLGVTFMIGAVLGFFVGGKMVDRWGTKPVFLVCHFGFCLVIFIFLLRAAIPGQILGVVGLVNFTYGMLWASSSIAISTEMMALIPPHNKSLTTSMFMVMWRAGGAMAGIISAWLLSVGALSESWILWGHDLSRYDTILLLFAVMIALLVVTLGLVPSVMRKAQWIPR
jgi:predicted MFS family arabinose efflux permease